MDRFYSSVKSRLLVAEVIARIQVELFNSWSWALNERRYLLYTMRNTRRPVILIAEVIADLLYAMRNTGIPQLRSLQEYSRSTILIAEVIARIQVKPPYSSL